MVGIALDEPGNVWGIHPTPADWGSEAANAAAAGATGSGCEPGQERRMALPPILQSRRIPPRQKIESDGVRPPTVAVRHTVIPTGAKRSGGTCFPRGWKCCRLAVMFSDDGGELRC